MAQFAWTAKPRLLPKILERRRASSKIRPVNISISAIMSVPSRITRRRLAASSRGMVTTLALAAVMAGAITANAASQSKLSREELRDKIKGAWAGQMIGVSYGAATEFKFNGKMIEGEIKPEPITNSIIQDDLYVEMTFSRVIDTKGLDATSADYGIAFRDSQYMLWHANAGARRNLNRGLMPPLSGDPRYNIHADDIDFQIEADFIGIMCPGMPRTSNRYCDRVGHVMNYGDGVYGGMFVCGMYAAAYFESDPRAVVEAGLACLPKRSGYALLIKDLLDVSAQNPNDWKKTWRVLQDKWDRHDPCPDGAFADFNIDARLNGAYIAMGLLYGGGDFDRTMEISTRCGQDSDCNPSNSAGILGAILGYNRLPAQYRADVQSIADTKFAYTDYSFNDIVRSSETAALKLIQREGGKVTDTEVTVRLQKPKAARLEQSKIGVPVKAVMPGDTAWSWKGQWAKGAQQRVSQAAGNEGSLKFEGTGVALQGVLGQDGGRADVYIDGKLQKLIADAWIPERTYDNDLWRITGLKEGSHELRIVTRADADERSKGKRLTVGKAVIYR